MMDGNIVLSRRDGTGPIQNRRPLDSCVTTQCQNLKEAKETAKDLYMEVITARRSASFFIPSGELVRSAALLR
jgi:hypothetical protein